MHGHCLHEKHLCKPSVIHHVVCQHQIEIEVWPAAAEIYFRDQPSVDPINTQTRFHATVYNAPSDMVTWKVTDITGGPGAGYIDPSGLYTAPPKGLFQNGLTDIVVATSVDDPFRKAYAQVTLVGRDPEPVIPIIEIFPKQIYLYYPLEHNNDYIDESNKMQLFRTIMRDSSSTHVTWRRNGALIPGWDKPWYLYKVGDWTNSGGTTSVRLSAGLSSGETDEAVIIMINYDWPGII